MPPAAATSPIAPADDSGIAKGASRATGGGPGLPAMSRRASGARPLNEHRCPFYGAS